MPNKTCIIETHYHSDYLSTLIQLYQKSDVYLTRPVYDDLPSSVKSSCDCNFPGSSSIKSFLSSIPTQNYDLLFVNTIQETLLDLKNWSSFNPQCKSVLTLHNLNAWHNKCFVPHLNLLHSFDSWASHHSLQKILNKFDYLSVCYEPMVQTAESYFKKPILFIPFALAVGLVIKEHHHDIWFTIPGTVSHKRRSYEPVLEAFEHLLHNFSNIRLYLLGKNEDRLFFESIPEMEDKIITYDNPVPREQYDQILRDSNFIIIPSKQQTNTINSAQELYGYTKAPNIHEATKWRHPIIVPDYLPVDKRLETSVLKYSESEDLYNSLHRLLSSKAEQNLLKKRAITNTNFYTLEKTRVRLNKILSK